ncbi:MAG: hypothetical protein IE912_17150, partial [Brevundimonas diminuta]|nr:hypothetical protein [Brevundimonas diminuta]
MSKSRLVASAALPFALVFLTACGSPAETPQPEQPSASAQAPALTRDAIETAVFAAAQAVDNAGREVGAVQEDLGGDNTRQAIAAFEK